MTTRQKTMTHNLAALMRDFYRNPENEAKFQAWMKKRSAVVTNPDRAHVPAKASTV